MRRRYDAAMSHAYRQLITVEATPQPYRDALPTAFTWRGERYEISHVNEPWHLQDYWWDKDLESDRWYYRVVAKVPGHRWDIIADIYHDRAKGVWILERVLD